MTHPNDALFAGEKPFPVIATCEHFAGNEKMIMKAFSFQDEKAPFLTSRRTAKTARRPARKKHTLK